MEVLKRSSPFYGWDRSPQKEIDRFREASPSFVEPIDEMWTWKRPSDMFAVQVHHMGSRKFGTMTHLTVKSLI